MCQDVSSKKTTFHRYFHVCGALRLSILHDVRESLLVLQREDGPDEVEVALAQERRLSGLVGVEEDGEVFRHARNLKVGQAVLHRAEELARAAQTQVLLGELEAVGGRGHDLQALARVLRLALRDEDAVRSIGAAADAAAQLVELGEAEALGVLDDHNAGIRHVDTDFDDGRRDEEFYPVCVEVLHDALLLGGCEPAMDEAARDAAKDAVAQLVVDLLG